MSMEVGPPPRIGADRLPVVVTCPDGTVLNKVRAVLTCPVDGTGRLLVWSMPRTYDPDVDTSFDRAASTVTGSGDWTVVTPEGDYTISGQRGCCSPLAHFPWPWATYRMGTL